MRNAPLVTYPLPSPSVKTTYHAVYTNETCYDATMLNIQNNNFKGTLRNVYLSEFNYEATFLIKETHCEYCINLEPPIIVLSSTVFYRIFTIDTFFTENYNIYLPTLTCYKNVTLSKNLDMLGIY